MFDWQSHARKINIFLTFEYASFFIVCSFIVGHCSCNDDKTVDSLNFLTNIFQKSYMFSHILFKDLPVIHSENEQASMWLRTIAI